MILSLAQIGAMASDRLAMHRTSHWSYSMIANVLYWQGVADELGGTTQLWQRIAAQPLGRSASHAS
jgi:hypothetical protein